MTTFTWCPSDSWEAESEPRVKGFKLGDGYEQREPDGINPISEIWNVVFEGRLLAEIDDIEAFFVSCGGVASFDWTPPRTGIEKKFICRSWKRSKVSPDRDTITTMFEQVHDA